MVAEIYPRMTSLIKNSKWRRDLLKGCINSTALQNEIPHQRENRSKVFEIITQSHRLSIENELSGYILMCAETDQDRRHRLEVLRQNDFVRSNER